MSEGQIVEDKKDKGNYNLYHTKKTRMERIHQWNTKKLDWYRQRDITNQQDNISWKTYIKKLKAALL